MNPLYQYLYAYVDAPMQGPSQDNARPVVIGDLDTRERPQKEEDAVLLSLI